MLSTRGSTTRYTTSIRMLIVTNMTAVNRVTPCTTGKSRLKMASIPSLPIPGTPKICSMINAPLRTAPTCRPTTVMIGIRGVAECVAEQDSSLFQALGARGTNVILGKDLEENWIASYAWPAPLASALMVSAGRNIKRMFLTGSSLKRTNPAVGNHPSTTANRRINMIASQKLGVETPSIANVVATISSTELGRLADRMPTGIATVNEINIASAPISSVTGSAARIIWTTDR